MTIETAQPSDFAEIEKIFIDGFADDARMYPIKRSTNLFVAKDNGKIVGAGGLFVNYLHGKVPKAAIAVDFSFHRKGIGQKLHQAILQSNPTIPLGIDGCCFDDDSSAISFLKYLNYQSYLDCYIPVIDTTVGFPAFDYPKNLALLNFNEATSKGIEEKAILRFLVDKYCESHDWNPVTIPKDSPDWEEIAFWGIDKELSILALIDDVLVGVSTASVDEDVLQIQWPFAIATDTKGELELLKTLAEKQFKIAHEKGIKKATFECDSTEEAMFQLPKELKILKSKTWRRFRYSP